MQSVGSHIAPADGTPGVGVRIACARIPALHGVQLEPTDDDDAVLVPNLAFAAAQPSRLGAFEVYLALIDLPSASRRLTAGLHRLLHLATSRDTRPPSLFPLLQLSVSPILALSPSSSPSHPPSLSLSLLPAYILRTHLV